MSSTMVAEPEMRACASKRQRCDAGARVEGVEPAVVGADQDDLMDDRRPRVDVAAGPRCPRDLPGRGHERVHAAVGRADVDAPVGDRRRGVEVALAEAAVAPEPGRPPAPRARARVVAVDVAVVGADDEQAAAVGGRALDRRRRRGCASGGGRCGRRARSACRPRRRSRACRADEQGGGLGAGADAVAPHALAVACGAARARRRPARRRRRGARRAPGWSRAAAATCRVQRRAPVLGLNEMTLPLNVSMKTPLSSTTGGNSASESSPARPDLR